MGALRWLMERGLLQMKVTPCDLLYASGQSSGESIPDVEMSPSDLGRAAIKGQYFVTR
jgi:hypothetical protein